jgi:hypothetical protein
LLQLHPINPDCGAKLAIRAHIDNDRGSHHPI